MYDLSSRDRNLGAAALEAVLDAQDERFISVLIEVMRGTEVGIFLGIDYDTSVSALENLSGESFGANWPAWVEWYGATDLSPPLCFRCGSGATSWKLKIESTPFESTALRRRTRSTTYSLRVWLTTNSSVQTWCW